MGKPLTLEEALDIREGDEIFLAEDLGFGWTTTRRLHVQNVFVNKIDEKILRKGLYALLGAIGIAVSPEKYENLIKVAREELTDIQIAADDLTKPIGKVNDHIVYAGVAPYPYKTYSKTPGD
jgi:hypothetical protein